MTRWKTRLTPEMVKYFTDNGYWEKERSLYDYFRDAVNQHPEQEMVVHRDRRFTYEQMDGLVSCLSSGLQPCGPEQLFALSGISVLGIGEI